MIDAVKIYGKTKEQFGWPDEPPEEFPPAAVSSICPSNLNQSNGTGESDSAVPAATSGTVLERYQHWRGPAAVLTGFHPPRRACVLREPVSVNAPSLAFDFQVFTQLPGTRCLCSGRAEPGSVLRATRLQSLPGLLCLLLMLRYPWE